MKIVKEFSRFASEYNTHNIIQSEVAKKLVSMLEKQAYSKVLDLGAGSGAVYNNMINKNIKIDKFVAFDFSKEMLNLHPKEIDIETVCSDFNNNFFEEYTDNTFSMLISASALQWSVDLLSVLNSISRLAPEHYFAFFTSKTFSTLHKVAGIESPIYSKKSIVDALRSSYTMEMMEEVEYHLNFDSVLEMFRYIKRSGVSGGSGVLSYSEMKGIMKNYPFDYLEFEVLFIKAIPK